MNIAIVNEDQLVQLPEIAFKIKEGWNLAFYPYYDEFRTLIYGRVRLDPPKGSDEGKWIRPVSIEDAALVLKEPSFSNGKPLYNLPAITKSVNEPIFIVEGEKCVDVLTNLKITATTSGAANSANLANWQSLAGKKVIIWPDNDAAGMRYAHDVTMELSQIASEIKWVDINKLSLPPKGDCVDWLASNPEANQADIENLLLIDPPTKLVEWPELIPLQRPLPPPSVFPIDALGMVLEPLCKKLIEVVQAPIAICGQSLLAAAALAAQGFANVVIDGRIYPLSEFFLTIAESGERKTSVDSIILKPHREHQEQLSDIHKKELLKYAGDKEAYEASKKEALSSKHKKTFDEKKKALTDLGKPPLSPIEPILLVEEPTYEGLIKLLAHGQPSVGLFSDEGGRFIGGHAMNDENMLKTASGLCKLWDGSDITRVRSGDGASILSGRRLSCHLMVQPVIAEVLLNNNGLVKQGFLSRFLITWPESTMGERLYKEINIFECDEYQLYRDMIVRIYKKPLPLKTDTANELKPIDLILSGDTKQLWIEFHNYIESDLSSNGKYSTIKGFANKAPEHAARLAGILALIENPDCIEISFTQLELGIKLTKYYLVEALRLFESSFCDPTLSEAERLYEWLLQREKNEIALQEIYQCGPSFIRNASKARNLIRLLAENHYVMPINGTYYNGKLCKEAWLIRLKE